MSLETDLYTVLTSLCPRVFPDVAPIGAPRPYVIYQQFGGSAPAFLEDTLPDLRNARFQIEAWDETRKAAIALALQIEAALVAAPQFQARAEAAFRSANDEDTDRRGCTQDFSIWGAR